MAAPAPGEPCVGDPHIVSWIVSDALYEQAVQQAPREVEDALVAYRKAREVGLEQEALVTASSRALELARLRYVNGLATYLHVLDAQRQLFDAELALAGVRRTQLVALV